MLDWMPLPSDQRAFYRDGLRFACVDGCSACCGGCPGYVWLTGEEVVAISRHLGIDVTEFLSTYTKEEDDHVSLKDLEHEHWNCIMLDKAGMCRIYEVRPRQCRTYPFWPGNLRTARHWRGAAKQCPGIGQGRLFSAEEIERIAMGQDTVDSVKSGAGGGSPAGQPGP